MNLLSLNFGHDASLALFRAGELVQFEELERTSRLKHQFGLTSEQVFRFLGAAQTSVSELDLATVCVTQFWALPHSADIGLSLGEFSPAHESVLGRMQLGPKTLASGGGEGGDYYRPHLHALGITQGAASLGGAEYRHEYLRGFGFSADALAGKLRWLAKADAAAIKAAQAEFFVPGTLRLRGASLPALFVDHHFCHANYAWFYSPQLRSIVCTHDGGCPSRLSTAAASISRGHPASCPWSITAWPWATCTTRSPASPASAATPAS